MSNTSENNPVEENKWRFYPSATGTDWECTNGTIYLWVNGHSSNAAELCDQLNSIFSPPVVEDKPDFEKMAEDYADSEERRGCAAWQGRYRGYLAACESHVLPLLQKHKTELDLKDSVNEALKGQLKLNEEEVIRLKEEIRKLNEDLNKAYNH